MRPAQHLGAEHLGGQLVALHHLDAAADALAVEGVAALDEQDELLEQPPDPLGVVGVTGDGDLVAADVDRHREGGLDQAEQLVALAEQIHHEVVPGYEDLELGG